jgi:hypothetical protein
MGTSKKTATLIETTDDGTQVYRLAPPRGEHTQVAIRAVGRGVEILAWPTGERILAMVPAPGDAAATLAAWQGYTVAGAGAGDTGAVTIFSRADADGASEAGADEPKPRRRKKGDEDGNADASE